eukprot:3218269-Rhodomonas_salina.1
MKTRTGKIALEPICYVHVQRSCGSGCASSCRRVEGVGFATQSLRDRRRGRSLRAAPAGTRRRKRGRKKEDKVNEAAGQRVGGSEDGKEEGGRGA